MKLFLNAALLFFHKYTIEYKQECPCKSCWDQNSSSY